MRKILVVEDEDNIRAFVVLNLKRVGYEVVDVGSGEAAMEAFEAAGGDFDIAILDIMLPGIDGFEVCRRIREKNSSIGIIMLSAKSQEMDKVQGLMLGADDYITKPFSPSELLARVDAMYRRVAMSGGAKGAASRKARTASAPDSAAAVSRNSASRLLRHFLFIVPYPFAKRKSPAPVRGTFYRDFTVLPPCFAAARLHPLLRTS